MVPGLVLRKEGKKIAVVDEHGADLKLALHSNYIAEHVPFL